eukprot:Blabericola_migrator_1__4263@NODE_2305_length_2967_cov_14_017586_g1443_i0_p1_GENE_NODE_2305_length_2967_cov_14_017586_g1443_i0NODE_2305_length_2967_cov_14_017586_g1443_i0_p1_ORF_typecomplete_len722_score100_34DUF4928/PF16280_5/0_26_NODE_2305_length_2967_cov_14_017586_g1443_i01322297
MSARRLQKPAPIGASEYKWLGTSIVTTLAILPQGSGASLSGTSHSRSDEPTETKPSEEVQLLRDGVEEGACGGPSENSPPGSDEPPAEQLEAIQNVLTDTHIPHSGGSHETEPSEEVQLLTKGVDEGACGGDTKREPVVEVVRKAVVHRLPDHFLDAQNILADFNESHLPLFIQPATQIKGLNVAAVQGILKAHEDGRPVLSLIGGRFREGAFHYSLIAHLRKQAQFYRTLSKGSLEARLVDAFVTGVKRWSADANDLFISQAEQALSRSVGATGGQHGEELALWNPRCYEEVALEEQRTFDAYKGKAFREIPKAWENWQGYKEDHGLTRNAISYCFMPAGKSRKTSLRKRLHFISWLLRNSTPKFFLYNTGGLIHAIRSVGGPCFIANLLQNLTLSPDDVAEYERLKKSVQGGVHSDRQEASAFITRLPADLPRSLDHLTHPLCVVDPTKVAAAFSRHELPPFLQTGYGLGTFKTEAINEVVELYHCGEHDKAMSVMNQEFSEAEEFHAHLFGLLRTTMRNYAFVPRTSQRSKEPKAWYPQEFSAPLKQLLDAYVTGLQSWCADVHGALVRQSERAIDAAYKSSTEDKNRFINSVKNKKLFHTRFVPWVKNRIDLSSMGTNSSPPEMPLKLHPEVASLRESLHTFDLILRHMPWDCFLFFRAHLAATVNEFDRKESGFSFLADIIQSLSFTNRDVDEFRQYCANEECHRSDEVAGKDQDL